MKKGLSKERALEAVIKGMNKGMEGTSLKAGLLLCSMVNGSDKENEETFELASSYLGKGAGWCRYCGGRKVLYPWLILNLSSKEPDRRISPLPYTQENAETVRTL